MREFKTIQEFQTYRKHCIICNKNLYFKNCGNIGNFLISRISYRSDDYIFTIGIGSTRIGYTTNSTYFGTNSDRVRVSSINPLIINYFCSTTTNSLYPVQEYSAEIAIFHNNQSQGIIVKINLFKECLLYNNNNKYYKMNLEHNLKKCTITELNDYYKTKNTFNLKYDMLNQDKMYNKDYLMQKINTINLLK